MITYITVADVDEILGPDWTTPDKKDNAVFMVNVWLNSLGLKVCPDNIPDDVKTAGAYAAKAAANGGLYQQKTDSGVITSKSVKADDVNVSKTFADLATNSSSLLDPSLQIALALLNPYGINSNQIRVYRG